MEVTAQHEPALLPSDRTIAFAISVVHSKPSELTIREYIELLRQHTAPGRRENALSSAYRHLDRSAYWRSECERLELLLKASDNKTIDLEAQIEKTVDAESSSRSKRKRTEAVTAQAKKSKLAENTVGEVLEVHKSGNNAERMLVRSVFQISTALHNSSDLMTLTQICVKAASVIPAALQQMLCNTHLYSLERVTAILTIAKQAILLLLTALTHLSKSRKGNRTAGQLTYACMEMCESILSFIPDTDTSIRPKETTSSSSGRATTRSKAKSRRQDDESVNPIRLVKAEELAGLIIAILQNLDPTIEPHRAVFEGVAYLCIEKTSSCLHLFVFGHSRVHDVRKQIQSTLLDSKTVDSRELMRNKSIVEGAEVLAPCLLSMLRIVKVLAPQFLEIHRAERTESAYVTHERSKPAPLIGHARDALQRTLMKCLFGSTGSNEENVLKRPVGIPPSNEIASLVQEPTEGELFSENVWALLGWEMLLGESW